MHPCLYHWKHLVNPLVIQWFAVQVNHVQLLTFLFMHVMYLLFLFFFSPQLLWTIPRLGSRQQRQKKRQPSELGLSVPVVTAGVLSASPLSSTGPTCVCYTGTRKTRNIPRSACNFTSHYTPAFIWVIFYWLPGNLRPPYTLLLTLPHVKECDNTLELM